MWRLQSSGKSTVQASVDLNTDVYADLATSNKTAQMRNVKHNQRQIFPFSPGPGHTYGHKNSLAPYIAFKTASEVSGLIAGASATESLFDVTTYWR